MKDEDNNLKKICELNGVSGYEESVISFLMKDLSKAYVDDIYIDSVGNLICYKKGKSDRRKIMINAHVDEVGFQVISRKDEYKYRIKPIGNIKTWNAVQQRVASNNIVGVIYAEDEENLKAHNFDNLYLRIINGEASTGDVFSFTTSFFESDNYYAGKALDNRIACYLLKKLINENIQTEADIYFAFTVQEEIGMRGIRVAKSTILPDLIINIDVSAECEMNSVKLFDGVGIKLSDSLYVSDSQCVAWAKKIAKSGGVKYQLEVSDCGTSEVLISNELDKGSKELGISIPCRYLHSSNSMISVADVEECNKFLKLILKEL